MQICIVKICSKEEGVNQNNATIGSGQNLMSNSKNNELENRIKVLEDKLHQLRTELKNITELSQTNSIQNIANSNVLQNTGVVNTPKEEIKEVIIKDKSKIIKLLQDSNSNLTNYASNVFIKIINESLNTNNPEVTTMRELFKSCKLIASSKEGGLLVFNEMDNMVKMAPNSKYKKYLESLFKRFIGVDYEIYTIQDHQYEILKDELDNPVQEVHEEKEQVEEEKLIKIDELFGDIIIETE